MSKKGKPSGNAVTSNLIRRPIQRYFAVFLLPTFLCFCIGFLWPFIQGIYLSFHSFTTIQNTSFVGFKNYVNALPTPASATLSAIPPRWPWCRWC